jgi:hypothetical protein
MQTHKHARAHTHAHTQARKHTPAGRKPEDGSASGSQTQRMAWMESHLVDASVNTDTNYATSVDERCWAQHTSVAVDLTLLQRLPDARANTDALVNALGGTLLLSITR